MSALAPASHVPAPGPAGGALAKGGRRLSPDVPVAALVAAALIALAFLTKGGVDDTSPSSGNTWGDIAVTVVGAGLVVAMLLVGRPQRRYGWVPVALMAVFAGWEGLSIIWSVLPDSSWLASDQMLADLTAFAGAVALARLAPRRWVGVLHGVIVALLALCAWSLLAKIFPATLAGSNTFGRVQAPFGYWNAIGVVAAISLPGTLWVGAREGHGRFAPALSAAGVTLALSVVVLSYSRSSALVAALVVVGWLAVAPLRLRSTLLLAIGAVGATVVCAWALGQRVFTTDHVSIARQDATGHTFGWILTATILGVVVVGWIAGRAADTTVLSTDTRHRIGAVLVGLGALIPVAAILALAASHRGLGGQISHGWHQLTNSHAVVGDNPGRVLQFGSSRPVYWHEGIAVGRHAPVKGVGELGFSIARLRHTTDPTTVAQAHGYLFETFADLGLIGVALTLGLLIAWASSAARPLTPARAARRLTPEWQGMVVLGLIVLGFGIQSTIDWTWYFLGVSVPVLLCAGWLAGRGPLGGDEVFARDGRVPAARPSLLDRPAALTSVIVVIAIVGLGVWFQWRPWHASQLIDRALDNGSISVSTLRAAQRADPLSTQPDLVLSSLELSDHDIPAARADLHAAIAKQPTNPFLYEQLALFEVAQRNPQGALAAIRGFFALDRTTDKSHDVVVGLIPKINRDLAGLGEPLVATG